MYSLYNHAANAIFFAISCRTTANYDRRFCFSALAAGALGGVIAAPPPTMIQASVSAFHTAPHSMLRPTIFLPSNEADSESQTSEGITRYRCRVYFFHSCCDSCRPWLCKRQVSFDVFATLITSSPSSSSRPLHPPGLFHPYRHRTAQLLPGASTPQRRTPSPLAVEQQEGCPVFSTPLRAT